MRTLVERAFLIAALLLPAIATGPSHGATPPDCGKTQKSIEEIEDLYFEARFQDAIQALDEISASSLAPACRGYVRSIHAQTLLKLNRENDARRVFQSALEEDASWRPDPSHADTPAVTLFDRVREEWLATRTGEFSVMPARIDFRSQLGETPAEKQTITIRSASGHDINWQAKDRSPWIGLSRESGFTSAGADSFIALLAPQRLPESATVQGGRIIVASGAFERTIDVTWETLPAGKKRPFYKNPLVLIGGGVAVAAIVIVAAGGGGGDGDEDVPDPLPGFPPPPPGPRSGFSFGIPW